MKNIEDLIDRLQTAVADYSYENKDEYFEIDINVYVEEGWVKCTVINKKNKNE